ncbi:MAG TPA: zinc-binding dehydrogenase [Abditibacteriaceae bacterium]|jgi:2-desacetyl-2-hydroxyethyl bacteriochlorophyllide A dehydrogenase
MQANTTTDTMQGVVLPGNRQLEFREFSVPKPGRGQVLLRMKASSLCGSDLRAIYRPTDQGSGPEAYRGVIAGHEPCGQIVEVGPDVSRFQTGDRVAVYHISGCGLCPDCRGGWMISCSDESRAAYGWQRDGGHADFMLAEAKDLVLLPEFLTYEDGAMVACGLGTAYAACLRAQVSGRDRVLITGLGPVGLGMALLCRALGAEVVGVESMESRIEFAKKLGFADVVAPGDDALTKLKSLTNGHGFEVAIDCSGAAPARHLCLEAAREWGRVVFVGEGGTVEFAPSPLLIHKQLALHGSWVCSIGQMEELVEKLAHWQLHVDQIVTHRFALSQAREAYELFDGGQTGKVAIVWD